MKYSVLYALEIAWFPDAEEADDFLVQWNGKHLGSGLYQIGPFLVRWQPGYGGEVTLILVQMV